MNADNAQLAGALVGLGATISQAMDEIESGSFGGGKAITGNMDNGGISLGKFSDKVSKDVQDKINEYADQIKAGTFVTDDEVSAIQKSL